MRDPEVAPCPAGGELENTIINMKKENAMQTFYDDTLKHLDPFETLSAGLEGKYLCYGGGVKPLQGGKSFAEGFIMRLADRPDNPENTIISVEPWLNKDGAPQLELGELDQAGNLRAFIVLPCVDCPAGHTHGSGKLGLGIAVRQAQMLQTF